MPPTDRFIASQTFYVRYAETDAMAVVHHASYIVYFEEGRSHYARLRGHTYAEFERQGYFLMVADIHVRYSKPARYGQQLTLHCWIKDLQSRAVTFGYEIVELESGQILVTGETRHICVTKEGQVAHIPTEWRLWANSL